MNRDNDGYKELIRQLRSEAGAIRAGKANGWVVGFEQAANAIETLMRERNTLHAHTVTDWLGDCNCSNCKRNIDYTSSYCNWCGAKLDEPEERE